MQLSRFQYDLPPERIAQYPAAERTESRLLRLDRHSGATDLDGLTGSLVQDVRPGDCWVINDTRVRPARVYCTKPTGGRVELLILSLRGTIAEAMYRSSKPLRPGQVLTTDSNDRIEVTETPAGGQAWLRFEDDGDAVLARAGQIPLPPYIDRAVEDDDLHRYQTVYAAEAGAVAAPTAGLHFTDALMAQMEAAGATFARVTLHVGPGTFRPIRTDDVRDHELHTEAWQISEDAATKINGAQRVVAVGTTSVRTLETAATGRGTVAAGSGETGLYITPGFDFQVVDAMLTNFHLPGSSLLVLVGAFCGVDAMMNAYHEALAADFRFYSYGDAMLIA